MHILVDEFAGDVAEFYELVAERVNGRQIPELAFARGAELETTRLLFKKGGGAKSLSVTYRKEQSVSVVAYQFGTSFLVSTYTKEFADKRNTHFLHDALIAAFEETVDRATREALTLYLEQKSVPIPPSLRPEQVFFSPQARDDG